MRIIGGKFKGLQLQAYGKGVRPSLAKLREALFNCCQTKVQGACFLDLYAGSGAIGIEALSRGAKEVVFVDKSKGALQVLKKNLLKLKIEHQTRILFGDVEKAVQILKGEPMLFDLVYLDPPYNIAERVQTDILPYIATSQLLNDGAWIFFEKEYSKEPLHLKNISLQLVKSRKYANSHLHQLSFSEKNQRISK